MKEDPNDKSPCSQTSPSESGHTEYAASKAKGWTAVPVQMVRVSRQQAPTGHGEQSGGQTRAGLLLDGHQGAQDAFESGRENDRDSEAVLIICV